MRPSTCPYLGLEDDPTTALGFPSEGNYCHHARPIAPVDFAQQERYCLNTGHINCPVYQRAKLAPLPAEMVAPSSSSLRPRWAVPAIIILLLVLGFTAVLQLAPGLSTWLSDQLVRIPQTGGQDPSDLPDPARFFLLESTPTPLQPETATYTPLPLKADCPLPEGWVPYIVHPTDSLFRLSVVYSVSVELLQQVNCMEDTTTILPGQILYIPFIPTRTPLPTAMLLQQNVTPVPPTEEPQTRAPSAPRPTATSRAPSAPAIPTPVPTNTSPPTATATIISQTPSLAPTATIPPTATTKPSKTPKPSKTALPTYTPSATALPTNTPAPTQTTLPTDTQAPPTPVIPAQTPSPTPNPLPSDTPQPSATTAPTATIVPTSLSSATPAPTDTSVPTATIALANTQAPTIAPTMASTDPPPPTATQAPTAAPTDPPPPTATDAPAPTATEIAASPAP